MAAFSNVEIAFALEAMSEICNKIVALRDARGLTKVNLESKKVTEQNARTASQYHTAAVQIRNLDRPIFDILRKDGRVGLHEIKGIGSGISVHILELTVCGDCIMWNTLLDRLRQLESKDQI